MEATFGSGGCACGVRWVEQDETAAGCWVDLGEDTGPRASSKKFGNLHTTFSADLLSSTAAANKSNWAG